MEFGDNIKIPKSVAIILDGNGRYAAKNNIPRFMGHKAGCDNLKVIIEESLRLNIKYLTVFAFSTENWKRSEEEVSGLFNLFDTYIGRLEKKATELKVRVNFIGDLTRLNDKMQKEAKDITNATKDFDKMVFTIAFNYGGRDEIVRAVNKIINSGENNITEDNFKKFLDTKDIEDPDLLIRTSGEFRVSNFLLWQIAYSEIYISDMLWPEFSIEEYHNAILSFNKRERRFGGRK